MSDMARLTNALEERYRIERQLGAGGIAVLESSYHGDAYMSRIVRP